MNLLAITLTLVVSYIGIIFGYILALIAPEELRTNRKLFKIGKWALFGTIFLLANYYLYFFSSLILVSIFSASMVIMFVLELVYNKKNYELLNYLIFTIPYVAISDDNFRLVFATAIFIYGLIAGTLIKKLLEI